MSKQKFDAEDAVPVAQELIALLAPFCERIEIAGSLRRCKERVGDIELLFIPRMETRQADMFTSEPFDLAAHKLGQLLAAGVIAKRPSETGVFTWGRLNKLAVHGASGIPVDFFCEPDPLDWPRSITIRTGPKEFNVRLMESAPRHGHQAHAYGEALHKIPGGERVIARSEREFIELCGLNTPIHRAGSEVMTDEQLLFHAANAADEALRLLKRLWEADSKARLAHRDALRLVKLAETLTCAAHALECNSREVEQPRVGG